MDTGISRREWIAGAAAGISFLAQPAHGSVANEDALDAALREIHASEPELKQGLSTHAPMVAEALSALDRGAEALPWIRGRRAPVLRLPGPSQRIVPEQWRAALGPRLGAASWESANHRWADWMEFFTAGVSPPPWREGLGPWGVRPSPGRLGGGAPGGVRAPPAGGGGGGEQAPEAAPRPSAPPPVAAAATSSTCIPRATSPRQRVRPAW